MNIDNLCIEFNKKKNYSQNINIKKVMNTFLEKYYIEIQLKDLTSVNTSHMFFNRKQPEEAFNELIELCVLGVISFPVCSMNLKN